MERSQSLGEERGAEAEVMTLGSRSEGNCVYPLESIKGRESVPPQVSRNGRNVKASVTVKRVEGTPANTPDEKRDGGRCPPR